MGGLFDEAQTGLAHLVDGDVFDDQIEFAGLDLGEVEDVVNQRQQVPATLFNMAERINLLRIDYS